MNIIIYAVTAIRHIDHKPTWEGILKHGSNIQILLLCIDYADTCDIGQSTNQYVEYCNQDGSDVKVNESNLM